MGKIIKAVLSWFLPASVAKQVANEISTSNHHWSSWVSNRNRYRGKSGLKLNIGCGPHIIDGWVNIDIRRAPEVFTWDCRKIFPFDDGSVTAIFSEHLFEHLESPGDTTHFLSECHRCLASGGILRIVVPDAGTYLKLYDGDWDGLASFRPLAKLAI